MSGVKITPADKAFGDCVKAAYDNTCQVCFKQGRMECSHIHSRRHRTIRWCKENALPKCHPCHRWWHEHPTESGLWFVETYGLGMENLLIEKKNNKYKIPKSEEKEIAKHYREQLKIIQEKRDLGHKDYIDFESYQ